MSPSLHSKKGWWGWRSLQLSNSLLCKEAKQVRWDHKVATTIVFPKWRSSGDWCVHKKTHPSRRADIAAKHTTSHTLPETVVGGIASQSWCVDQRDLWEWRKAAVVMCMWQETESCTCKLSCVTILINRELCYVITQLIYTLLDRQSAERPKGQSNKGPKSRRAKGPIMIQTNGLELAVWICRSLIERETQSDVIRSTRAQSCTNLERA